MRATSGKQQKQQVRLCYFLLKYSRLKKDCFRVFEYFVTTLLILFIKTFYYTNSDVFPLS